MKANLEFSEEIDTTMCFESPRAMQVGAIVAAIGALIMIVKNTVGFANGFVIGLLRMERLGFNFITDWIRDPELTTWVHLTAIKSLPER